MKIQYYGHSSFAVTSKGGTRLVTDPYGHVGFSMPHLTADAVTISHGHFDHCNADAVASKNVLCRAGRYSVGDFAVEAVRSFHDDCLGRKRGENLIFRMTADGVTLCHLGDLGEKISPELLRRIGHADVLLVPVGGNYTIDGIDAARLVKEISPSIAIPMHYYVEGLEIDIAGPEAFLSRFEHVEHLRGELEIGQEMLGGETKIYLLEKLS